MNTIVFVSNVKLYLKSSAVYYFLVNAFLLASNVVKYAQHETIPLKAKSAYGCVTSPLICCFHHVMCCRFEITRRGKRDSVRYLVHFSNMHLATKCDMSKIQCGAPPRLSIETEVLAKGGFVRLARGPLQLELRDYDLWRGVRNLPEGRGSESLTCITPILTAPVFPLTCVIFDVSSAAVFVALFL